LTIALYATIWASLLLFAIGETGRHVTTRAWPRAVFIAGLLLCLIHITIAMGHVHGWSHAAAMAATAAQASATFGLDWGGGVFVNYAFVLAWGLDAALWRAGGAPRATGTRRWLLRIFYAIVLLNAAVVFAAGARRLLGLAIVIWLLWMWSRREAWRT
jgi:hypothetical protein